MKITETDFPGLKLIEPIVYKDIRGYFFESYNLEKLRSSGIHMCFKQDNQSSSQYGVIRGLHYQKNPYAQTKLIRVLQGKIYDVAVDLRVNSPTFGQWYGLEISDENHYQLLIPKGFAHGFSVLSDSAVVFYKCDEIYKPESEDGIIYSDPDLVIDWKIPPGSEIISDKDQRLERFRDKKPDFMIIEE
jgi:dTDP-4-dehydrorhamnose 3,5-epimerase